MKKYRVIVEEDGVLQPIVIADHYLQAVQFEGKKGFISDELYQLLFQKETQLYQLLYGLGVDIEKIE